LNTFLDLGFKGKNNWELYIVGVLIIITSYFIGQIPLMLLLWFRMNQDSSIGSDALTRFQETMDFTIFGINPNVGFLFMIMIFVFAMLGLLLTLQLHKKSLKDLVTPKRAIDWNKIFFSFLFWAGLTILFESISYFLAPETYTFRFELSNFLPLLLIAFFIFPIQTSFEELFFRGYIMQGLGVFIRNKYMPLIISSIMFALMHGTNPEVEKFGFLTMMSYYIFAGLFLGIITIMDDSLELALGVHAATNIMGATLVTYSGSVIQTDSLFLVSEIKPILMLVFFMVGAFIFYLVCQRRYNWKPIQTVLEDRRMFDQQEIAEIGRNYPTKDVD